jgi:DNA-binding SARP family transcriptional activator
LTQRFKQFAQHLGRHLELNASLDCAIELYQRVLELDPLAESFYRRQMICMRAQGRRAEAIEVFRRCRHMLSIKIGVAPAAESEALLRELLGS